MDGPDFCIGDVAVRGNLVLAPMDGYTSHPFRLLVKRLGAAMCVSEFVNPVDVIHGHPRLEEKLFFSEDERPFGYQLLDNDPQRILRAAEMLVERKPDFIDINLGCPARFVCSRGAGAGLLKEPAKIVEIFRLLTVHLPLPITAKIRLGWDDASYNHVDVVKLLADNGAAAISIHGRSRKQAYRGDANWAAIGEAKKRVSIPIIANGDVKTPADIDRIMRQTGADGVMIGRAAVNNPWIFQRRDRSEISLDEMLVLIREQVDRMLQFFGHPHGLILFRKHLIRYLTPYQIERKALYPLLTCEDPSLFHKLLEQLLSIQSAAPVTGAH